MKHHSSQAALISAFALLLSLFSFTAAQSLPALRIQTLGDSITKGSGSSDGNGYRKRLRNKLTHHGFAVDMIGSLRNGDMPDNDHEGHSGKYLADIAQYWKRSIQARPNVVLIHAGTNNMDKEVDLAIAPRLIESIIDDIFSAASDAAILVAPVIWANSARMQANTDAFNHQLEQIILDKQQAGKHILSVRTNIGLPDLSDMKHPNNAGYEKMASAWYSAVIEAQGRGWLSKPRSVSPSDLPGMGLGSRDNDVSGTSSCVGGNWERAGTVFDGPRVWEERGVIRAPVEGASRDRLILADLNKDGIADYILPSKDGNVTAWINGGKPGQWTSLGQINPPWSKVTGDMIRMADVDGDGRADMIVLYQDGAAKVWRNVDNGKRFESLDSNWATGLASRDKVRFEDVDGDGYADYVILYAEGAVKWARNTRNNGKDPNKRNWEPAETIAPGPDGVPKDRVRLYDLDGDKKTDYVIVYAGGAVKALRNTGNLNKNANNRNWEDLGTIAPGVKGVTGDAIRFADMDGDGLADFLAVGEDGSIRMWKNLGITGSKDASIKFADLTGDGRADIISVDASGRARAWINRGILGEWIDAGVIAPGPDEDLSQARIEFADVNGDKLADYLVIYGGGAVKAFLNNGNIPDVGKGRIWSDGIVISPGVGEPGRKVQFADLDGDGFSDYLVVYDGGAVKYYRNNRNIPSGGGRIWQNGYTVATGVGDPGEKVRFADITGDGKDEYLIQYDGGAAISYRNSGNIPKTSDKRNWLSMGTIAAGVNPQGAVQYADINGDGKDDYLVVFEDGRVNAYINTCDWIPKAPAPGNNGGDNGGDNGGTSPDDEDQDDFEEIAADRPPCMGKYYKLSEVESYARKIPSYCMDLYLANVQIAALESSLNEYDRQISKGYDKKFSVYERAMRQQVPSQIHSYMASDRANKYFRCHEERIVLCCKNCGGGWTECTSTCDKSSDCKSGKQWLRMDKCPTLPSSWFPGSIGNKDVYATKFELVDSDGFYKDIAESRGVLKSWITLGERLVYVNPGCGRDPIACQAQNKYWEGYPIPGKIEIPDPKELVSDSYKDTRDLANMLKTEAMLAMWSVADSSDLLDAAALPSLMVASVVKGMAEVVETANDIIEQERKQMISMWVSSILMLVPFAGQLAGSAGLAALRAALVLAGDAAALGWGIYEVVEDPESAVFAVLGFLLGGTRSRRPIQDAAEARRAMSSKELKGMGPDVKKDIDKMTSLRTSCFIR